MKHTFIFALCIMFLGHSAFSSDNGKLAFSYQTGEYSVLGVDGDVDGGLLELDLSLLHTFSANLSFGQLEVDDVDAELTDIRATLRNKFYEKDQISLTAGLGYADQSIETFLGDLDGSGVLTELIAGFSVNEKASFAVAVTHAFATSVPDGFSKEDLTELEATFDYSINESISGILSYRSQISGDTIIENEGVFTLGIGVNF